MCRIQKELELKLVKNDSREVSGWTHRGNAFGRLRYVAGVDISFDKEREHRACAMLAVLSFPDLRVLHMCSEEIEMTESYIPGFLAFREVDFLLDRLKEVREKHSHMDPQAILVDGNGILHPRGVAIVVTLVCV